MESKSNKKLDKSDYDFVNPSHYKQGSKEVWEMMVDIWGEEAYIAHCEMCAFKYRQRLGLKPDQPVERDLDKARWYENKAKELRAKISAEQIEKRAEAIDKQAGNLAAGKTAFPTNLEGRLFVEKDSKEESDVYRLEDASTGVFKCYYSKFDVLIGQTAGNVEPDDVELYEQVFCLGDIVYLRQDFNLSKMYTVRSLDASGRNVTIKAIGGENYFRVSIHDVIVTRRAIELRREAKRPSGK